MAFIAQMALTTPQLHHLRKSFDVTDKNNKKYDKTVLIQYHKNGTIFSANTEYGAILI